MRKTIPLISLLSAVFLAFAAGGAQALICIDCHKKVTPRVVSDWQLSKHSKNGVACPSCHGDKHTSAQDTANAQIPTPETCGKCHAERLSQYKAGKHALAWAALKAMPTIHWQPMALIEGMKGCGGCHKIGIKSAEEIKELKKSGQVFGNAACDSCHTRHIFSVQEARQPQACETCHTGFDHPQWEMYSGSKHGVRFLLKQERILPEDTAAPTCQTCHMQEGSHTVRAAWGFLGVRLPMPEDKQWAADRATILQALGVSGPEGRPAPRLEIIKQADVARLTQEEWQKDRDRMIATCHQCHSLNFVKAELGKGDKMIKAADHLMAEAIRIVAGLYQDGLLAQPRTYAHPFPDLLTFFDAPTVIEQKLFVMFSEHRMRTFQGTFHANPDYALWYGWSELQRDLTEIKEMAAAIREKAAKSSSRP
jgi:hydroxylamine dehydrogenase